MIALLIAGAALAQDPAWAIADFPIGFTIENCPSAEADCAEALADAFDLWSDECLAFEVYEAGPALEDGSLPEDTALHVVFGDPDDALDPTELISTSSFAGRGTITIADVPFMTDAAIAAGNDCTVAHSLTAVLAYGVGSLMASDLPYDGDLPVPGTCDVAVDPTENDRSLLGAAFVDQADFTCVPNLGPEVVGAVPFDVTCTVDEAVGDLAVWRFGDGSTAEGAVVEHTYKAAGNFTVSVGFGDDPDVCALAAGRVEKLGYVRACAEPDVSFELFHNGGLTYTVQNYTDVSVYGCLYDIEWSLFRGGPNGKRLEGPIKAWEPTFEIPDEGRYTIKGEASGVGGKGAAVMTFEAQRGVGDGLQAVTCGTACNTAGGGAAGWPALVVSLLALFRRRQVV